MTDSSVAVIRRYSNRKLYDPQTSCYVTVRDLIERVKLRQPFKVEEYSTGENVTSEVLAQIVVLSTAELESPVLLSFLETNLGLGSVNTL